MKKCLTCKKSFKSDKTLVCPKCTKYLEKLKNDKRKKYENRKEV